MSIIIIAQGLGSSFVYQNHSEMIGNHVMINGSNHRGRYHAVLPIGKAGYLSCYHVMQYDKFNRTSDFKSFCCAALTKTEMLDGW